MLLWANYCCVYKQFLGCNLSPNSQSDASVVYNLFPARPHLRMNFLEEFLVGHELKFLSHKVHASLIRDWCLAHSQNTKCTKKVNTFIVHNSCLHHSKDTPYLFTKLH
jgi:hypothetical protein